MFAQKSTDNGLLVLSRHGESEGNRLNIFTGWLDLPLTEQGQSEARALAERLAKAKICFEAAFSSRLQRARQTASIILDSLGQDIGIESASALNERNYGDLTGLNKATAVDRWGAEQVRLWRRSFELRPPHGESLRDTTLRVAPFYNNHILPLLLIGKHTLVVAHGNSLRALIMIIESLSAVAIETVELRTGEVRIYEFDRAGAINKHGTL